jgi:GrpB-like predicted nucleotidyltransferase (UPF0157 family)
MDAVMVIGPKKIVGPYEKPEASFNPYDPRAPEVAAILKKRLESYSSKVIIEHIGSTAIPECPGKGIVDLMALYPDQHLDKAKKLLLAFGFRRQGKEFKNRFPDSRPVFMGTFEYDNTPFLIYVHVIREDSYEAVRFRIFRDRLRSDPELLSEYISVKKKIISRGVVDTDEYVELKRPVIRKILGEAYDEKSDMVSRNGP